MNHSLGLIALIVVAGACHGSEPPQFVLEGVRDQRPTGPLVQMMADGSVELGGAKSASIKEFVALRRANQPSPPLPHDRPHVQCVNGDRVPGLPVAIEGERLRFAADLGAKSEIVVPLTSVTAIWLTPRAATFAATDDGRRMLEAPRRQDMVRLTNGDTLKGTLTSATADGPFVLTQDGTKTEISRERIDAILFNTDLARTPKPRGTWRRLVLANGSRLSLRSARLEAGDVIGTMLTGAEVRVPLALVAALYAFGGPAVYLSDLTPNRYESKPFLDVAWPLVADRSVAGRELRLAEGTFEKGLGLHAACKVSYALPPGSVRFEALVGLDDATGRRGAATIQVQVDGRPLLESPLDIRGGQPARELRLPLPNGSKELTLEVGFGPGGDVQDHVNWVNARIIAGAK